jgi:hypothetical protein
MINYDSALCAKINPRLAYMLECEEATLIPGAYAISATFTDEAIGNPVTSQLSRPMAQAAWITSMQYTIRSNAFAGNIFATQYQQHLRENPFLSVELYTSLGRNHAELSVTRGTSIPLELLASPAGACPLSIFNDYMTLDRDMQVFAKFTQDRVWDHEETPLTVTLVLNVLEIENCCLNSCSLEHARRELGKCKAKGLSIPSVR